MLLRDLDGILVDTVLEPPFSLLNNNIIAAHLPLAHATIICKRPVLEAITPLPLPTRSILVLVPELDCDFIVGKGEELFPQDVMLLFLPFAGQELDNGCGAGEELVAIAPDAVRRVGFDDFYRIPCCSSIRWRVEKDGSTHTVCSRRLGPS